MRRLVADDMVSIPRPPGHEDPGDSSPMTAMRRWWGDGGDHRRSLCGYRKRADCGVPRKDADGALVGAGGARRLRRRRRHDSSADHGAAHKGGADVVGLRFGTALAERIVAVAGRQAVEAVVAPVTTHEDAVSAR